MIDIKSINEVLRLFATETGAFVTTETGIYIDMTIPGEENIVLSLPVTHECEHVMELMNADHIKLSFSSTIGVTIPIGSYVVWDGITYRLTKPYTPTRKNEIEYRYEPEFQSKVMGWSIKPFFFLTKSGTTVIRRETDWQLTGTPTDFLNAVKDSILDETGETYTFSIASGLTGSKTLSFESTDILSALNSIAETFETEWWVSGTVIYLGDCSIGTAVTLETGIHMSVPEVTKSDKGFYTRFYAFGSSRNIVQDYVAGSTTNYVVEKRLSLPVTTCPDGYKDIRPGLTIPEIASKSLIFDHIYPKLELAISEIRTEEKFRVDAAGNKIILSTDPETGVVTYETYNIYFFKAPSTALDPETIIPFDPATIVEGKTLSVHFNSGYLLDMEFELVLC